MPGFNIINSSPSEGEEQNYLPTSFGGELKSPYDIHRNHRWLVTRLGPIDETRMETAKSPYIFAESFTLPVLAYDTLEIKGGYVTYKFPSTPSYEPASMTIYDTYGLHSDLQDLWVDRISPRDSKGDPKGFGAYDSFKKEDVVIKLINGAGDEVRRYTLKYAWIKDITHSDLVYSNSELKLLTLTIDYDWYQITERNADSSSSAIPLSLSRANRKTYNGGGDSLDPERRMHDNEQDHDVSRNKHNSPPVSNRSFPGPYSNASPNRLIYSRNSLRFGRTFGFGAGLSVNRGGIRGGFGAGYAYTSGYSSSFVGFSASFGINFRSGGGNRNGIIYSSSSGVVGASDRSSRLIYSGALSSSGASANINRSSISSSSAEVSSFSGVSSASSAGVRPYKTSIVGSEAERRTTSGSGEASSASRRVNSSGSVDSNALARTNAGDQVDSGASRLVNSGGGSEPSAGRNPNTAVGSSSNARSRGHSGNVVSSDSNTGSFSGDGSNSDAVERPNRGEEVSSGASVGLNDSGESNSIPSMRRHRGSARVVPSSNRQNANNSPSSDPRIRVYSRARDGLPPVRRVNKDES